MEVPTVFESLTPTLATLRTQVFGMPASLASILPDVTSQFAALRELVPKPPGPDLAEVIAMTHNSPSTREAREALARIVEVNTDGW
jgi:hypothetical protein